jgi:ATP-dependent exoDNAse (exonuclease V) beta subunit
LRGESRPWDGAKHRASDHATASRSCTRLPSTSSSGSSSGLLSCAHLNETYPGGIWRREWPVVQVHEGQLLSGRIDLVVEFSGALAVYDHKSFPRGRDRWPDEVAAYAPQLQTYAAARQAATGLAVALTAVHLPVSGTMLVLEDG